MKRKVFSKITGEFLDSLNSNLRGVVKIINYDGFESSKKELQNGVASDVTGTAGDQNVLRHEY